MKYHTMRKAFSMITAIFIIVIMATVAIFVTNLSGKIVKSTTTQFQSEQARLYAKSYTEYAILAITGNNRSVNCLKTINGTISSDSSTTDDNYNVTVQIAYIGSNAAVGSCAGGTRDLNSAVTTTGTPLTAVIDVYVTYRDIDHPNGNLMTVHRRTVQKI